MNKISKKNITMDKKLKILIIKTYPFINNGESYKDDDDKIFLHYIGVREAFLIKKEWTGQHELMFFYVIKNSQRFKELIDWHFENNLMTALSTTIKEEDVPRVNIDILLY